jgi:nitrogen fixation/metabolism regulation signal transduction histidine kinase
MSKREKELNQLLNRIKEILSKARQETIENEKFLSIIVESVSTGIIILDGNNVQTANHAATQLLGLPVFTHLNQLSAIDENFPELFKNLDTDSNLQIKITNELEEKEISLHLSKIKLKKGTIKVITLNNIGNELESREMESWIRLIRVMTHEIMNSIAPITSLTETLLFTYRSKQTESSATALERNTIEALQTISTTAKGLITFVESYRKFTGIPQPQVSPFELNLLIEKILLLENSALEAKGITTEIIPADQTFTLNADEAQVTQILINIIKNAIESTEHDQGGKIQIRISAKDHKIRIDIGNNGQPIPPDIVPHIFIPFFTTKESGTGIGLSLSRYIMRLHGGNLKHYTLNEWTVFSLIF